MKQYTYVTICANSFFGMAIEKHRQIIDDYASKGYRYVGYIPTEMNSHGVISEMDLIFEKDV